MNKHKYIKFDPEIFGGKPVIAGTRIPVSRILFLLKDSYSPEAIHQEYPQLDLETIKGTIDEITSIVENKQNASFL